MTTTTEFLLGIIAFWAVLATLLFLFTRHHAREQLAHQALLTWRELASAAAAVGAKLGLGRHLALVEAIVGIGGHRRLSARNQCALVAV